MEENRFIDFVMLRLFNNEYNIDESMLVLQYNNEYNTNISKDEIKKNRLILVSNSICDIGHETTEKYYILTAKGKEIMNHHGSFSKYIKYKKSIKYWISIDKTVMYFILIATLLFTILAYLK